MVEQEFDDMVVMGISNSDDGKKGRAGEEPVMSSSDENNDDDAEDEDDSNTTSRTFPRKDDDDDDDDGGDEQQKQQQQQQQASLSDRVTEKEVNGNRKTTVTTSSSSSSSSTIIDGGQDTDEDNIIVKYLKGENEAMMRESLAARRESSALKSKLELIIVAAQQDIEMGARDMGALQNDHDRMKLRFQEAIRSHQSLAREHEKLQSELVAAKAESEALHHEFKRLNRDHETQQAKWRFDQAELNASKKHVRALEQEVQALRTIITEKVFFTETSTTQHSLDYRNALDALRKEKEMAELEIEKVLDRNKNQATLLQRLEKRLHQIESTSDAQIEQLQKQLNEERKKNARLIGAKNAKVPMFGASRSPLGSYSVSPVALNFDEDEKGDRASQISPNGTMSPYSSASRNSQMESANKKYTSLRDLLQEEKHKQVQILNKPEEERSESERDLGQALAERKLWKKTSSLDGSINENIAADAKVSAVAKASGTSQASFLEAAIQKQNQKTGFWDKLFGGDHPQDMVLGSSSMRLSTTLLLSDSIKEAVLENQRFEVEREKRIKERERKEREQAQASLNKLKTGVRWGLFSMFDAAPGSDMDGSSHHKPAERGKASTISSELAAAAVAPHSSKNRSTTPTKESSASKQQANVQEKNAKVELTMADVDDIDMDTLRRLAAERTKDLSEDQLNKILAKRRSSLIAMAERGCRPSRMSALSEFSIDDWDEEFEDEEEEEQ